MSTPVEITVRYFAAARAAAATDSEQVAVPAGATVEELVDTLSARNEQLAQVLPRCSYLSDGMAVRDPAARLQAGAVIDVLPPFAGG
ncbi:MoaD/ThiS family protein [Mycobacterium koreense]|uniref:Molybdopterin synthase sulfur carrier subunit n=1 Tax=Mycolicibacillus koreensis TaxID=1069220 RepID=A0A7I7SKL3_9MYCO|nr:MoaD/ThiS family protein [Mycolicibacillus koreensis]MCV7247364.1 MoaD/ThiS family protein [Mycolicibacillus koreensis]OSC34436.1 molybdopterin synthase sulfur carrier subunit [Mycolicibacillus koreensis]BBY56555.1 molybdopterin synthase sulfur carrier subunit [Mycolicibacillus koreensis]